MYLNLPIKCMIIEHFDMSESERTNINGKKQYYPEYACTRTKHILRVPKCRTSIWHVPQMKVLLYYVAWLEIYFHSLEGIYTLEVIF